MSRAGLRFSRGRGAGHGGGSVGANAARALRTRSAKSDKRRRENRWAGSGQVSVPHEGPVRQPPRRALQPDRVLDVVQLRDQTWRVTHLARLIQPGVEEVPPRMGPATHRDEPPRGFRDHGFIRRIRIRLQITAVILEDLGRLDRGAEQPGTERSPEPDYAGVSGLDLQVSARVGINDRHRQEGGGCRGRRSR